MLEKLVVVYKLIEGFETMFGFFKDIKASLQVLHAKLDVILNHVTAAPTEVKAEVAEAVTEVKKEV